MKIIIIYIIFTTLLLASNDCENISNGFINHLGLDKSVQNYEILSVDGLDVGCVADFSDGGYIVISNALSSHPIKSYSLNGSFALLQPEVKDMLINDLYIQKINETSQIHKTREYLLNLQTKSLMKLYSTSNIYLPIDSQWNQDGLYNIYMPKVNGQNTLVGCVNVALGQIMRHHQYPQYGKGAVNTSWNGDVLQAITNRKYNWQNMPSKLDINAKEHEIDEVAMLLYDLAIANKTEFGINGSGASFFVQALYENFGYSTNILKINASDKNIFFDTIKNEINSNRPMFLTIPAVSSGGVGHAVVVDGFNDDAMLGKFIHVNFGWGGSYDGYMNIDTSSSIEGLNLTSNSMNLYYNIKPCTLENNDCYDDQNTLEDGDFISNNTITGKIDFSGDEDIFEIYLDDTTEFIASSPEFSNFPFFINLYDLDSILLDSFNQSKSLTLTKGKYKIIVSMTNHQNGTFYQYNQAYQNSYNINISTNYLSNEEIAIIDNESKKAPFIFDNRDFVVLKTNETKKLLINGASLTDSTTFFGVAQNSNILDVIKDDNIFTLSGKSEGITKLTIKAFANSKETHKDITVLVVDDGLTIGNNGIIVDKFLDTNPQKIFDYQVLLDGTCTIDGDRGFSNNAFYMKIDNSIYNTYQNSDINGNFIKGIYTLNVSLYSSSGYYTIDNSPDFTININCSNITNNIEYLANALSIQYNQPTPYSKNISNNWNLISLGSNDMISIDRLISTYPNIEFIWQYIDGKWSAYSQNSADNITLKDLDIDLVDYITSSYGFWIKSNDSFVFNISGENYENNFSTLSNQWTLVSISDNTTPMNIFETNSSIKIIWQYVNGQWQGYSKISSQNELIANSYNLIENIERGNGLWVYVE